MSSGALFKKGKRGPRGQNSQFWLQKRSFWQVDDKGKQQKILFLKISVFYEFRGPLKGALMGPKGPLRAKSRSFGDRNIIYGKQAQYDKVKQEFFIFLMKGKRGPMGQNSHFWSQKRNFWQVGSM